ncbi:MAG: hypothetical protein NTX50_30760 [Candidatus Sumerlaeota bacterium]|nr:hypothetical protein [Candidatus Sumerlaeota bacterium]
MAIFTYYHDREYIRAMICAQNLAKIEGAKEQLGLEGSVSPDCRPTWYVLVHTFLYRKPVCPSGGKYEINDLNTLPTCSHPGHLLEAPSGETPSPILPILVYDLALPKDRVSSNYLNVREYRKQLAGIALAKTPSRIFFNQSTSYYFLRTEKRIYQLWRNDYNGQGARMILEFRDGTEPSIEAAVHGLLYISADNGNKGRDIWTSDGTASGSNKVASFPNVNIYRIFCTNNVLFTVTYEKDARFQIFKSDGAYKGTILLEKLTQSGGSKSWCRDADKKINDYMLGAKDIVSENLFDIKEIDRWQWVNYGESSLLCIGQRSLICKYCIDINGVIYFMQECMPDRYYDKNYVKDGFFELWKSDRTETGTVKIREFPHLIDSPYSQSVANVNGTLYFVGTDRKHGRELWKSDGTSSGTVMVKDIWPGEESSCPSDFAVVNGTLYFIADDGVYDPTLWKSDGTDKGTVRAKSIR